MNKILGIFKTSLKFVIYNVYLFFCGLFIKLSKVKYLLFLAPGHGNIGDQAIALSELQYLKELGIKPFEVKTKAFDYSGSFFPKMIPSDAVILVHGGGFLGTLWKHEEQRVRKVFKSFPNNKIVVFPQTVTFSDSTQEDKVFFEESKSIYSYNKKMTLFVREENSFNYIKDKMPGVNVKLVPDIVTRFKVLNMSSSRRNGIVFCFRRDHEKSLTDSLKEKVIDSVKEIYPDELTTFTDTVVNHNIGKNSRKEVVGAKLKQFGQSKLVITDRLHGMVMAAITDTPCIAFGNSNGKVKGVYSWIKNNEFIKYVDNIDQFKDALKNLNLNKKYEYFIDETLFTELSNAITK